MKSYTGYIVDDEPLAIRSLRKKLEKFPEIEIIGEATRLQKALNDISEKKPEVLFLDIQLTECTGFDLLDKLKYTGKVIFVTAFDEYAFRAFEINAVAYLLKPISNERLASAIERVKSDEYYKASEGLPVSTKFRYSDRILVVERDQIRFILLEVITLISAARDYTMIETIDGKKSLMMRSMAEWMNRLPSEHFIRIHRSYIVNINHIEKIIRNSTTSARVYIKNHNEPISLSRTYYSILKERYL
jgi:two-component system LytT family response regulator